MDITEYENGLSFFHIDTTKAFHKNDNPDLRGEPFITGRFMQDAG